MNTNRRRALLGSVVVLLGAGAVAAALVVSPDDVSPTAASPTATAPTATAPADAVPAGDYVPPSPSAPYTIEPEPTFVATDEPRPSDAGLTVVLTYATFERTSGTVQANGFVAGTIVEGGTCTLTLTRGDQRVTTTSTSIADATTTSCGLLETGPGLEAGTWEAVLSYEGRDSAAMEVTVP